MATVQQTIGILNHMLSLDKKAMTRIMNAETAINGHLAEWEDLPIHYNENYGTNMMRLLGVINALHGAVKSGKYQGQGQIWTIRDDEGFIEKFVHYTELDNPEYSGVNVQTSPYPSSNPLVK